MSEWIRADYTFGKPMKAIFFSGEMLERMGFPATRIFNSSEACEHVFKQLKDYWPTHAILMRVSMAYARDGVTFWIMSSQFPRLGEGEAPEEIDIESFIESQRR